MFGSNKAPCPNLARPARPLELQSIFSQKNTHACCFIIISLIRQIRRGQSRTTSKGMRTLITAGLGKKDIEIHWLTILLNCKVHARVFNNKPQEYHVDQIEHLRDIPLVLSTPTVSDDTHPTTLANEVGLTSTTATLTVHYTAPISNPASPHHNQAMLHSLTQFHIISTSQSLALHANDYLAGTSTAAGTVVALPTN